MLELGLTDEELNFFVSYLVKELFKQTSISEQHTTEIENVNANLPMIAHKNESTSIRSNRNRNRNRGKKR